MVFVGLHLSVYPIFLMTVCVMLNLVSGGTITVNVRWQITLRVIQRNQISVSLWMSGRHYTSPSLVNAVSSIVRVQTSRQTRMVVGLLKGMSLVRTLVQRLFYAAVSSVIYQRLWFVRLIHPSLFWKRFVLQQS